MAPAPWCLVLVVALAAAASADEVDASSSTGVPPALVDDDVCLGADEECSLSLRQLRHRQQQQEVTKVDGEEDVDGAAKLADGAKGLDMQLESGGAEEGTDAAIAEAALADSTSSGHHHHHHHHRAENQLRWAPDSKYCMSVDGNVFGNGRKMQLWECSAGMGQYFDYVPTEPSTLLRSAAAPGFCVVVDGNQNHNGAKVQLWQCDPSSQAQHWIMKGHGYQSVLLKSAAFPGKCLVVNGNRGVNGNKLQIWDCHGDKEFKLWTPTR